MKKYLLLLISLVAMKSLYAVQAPGYVCDNCINYPSAEQEAELYAPGLSCTNPFSGEPLQCTSTPKNVVLVNLANEEIYPFRVTRQTTPPFSVNVNVLTLPSQQYNNFVTAVEAVNAINAGFEAIYSDWNQYTGRFNNTTLNESGPETRSSVPASCPSGTVLEALTDDSVMDEIIEQARDRVRNELSGINASGGSATSGNVSIGFGSVRGSISSSSGDPLIPDSVKFTFTRNELGISSFDHLAFRVEVLLSINEPILTLQLGASRIFGQTATRVLGGTQNITNECALARLAALPQTRPGSELRLGGIPVDTSGGFPEPGGGVGGTGSSYCTYELYQNGGFEYSFRAPCVN